MFIYDLNSIDYKEAFYGTGPVYIGSLKPKCFIAHMIQVMNKTGQFKGMIFNPERPSRNDDCTWSYQKNLNFIAGAIAAKRFVILVTRIENYNHPEKNIGMSHHEMMWLKENGYTHQINVDSVERITFIPPKDNRQVKISAYVDDDGKIMMGKVKKNISVCYTNFTNNVKQMVDDLFSLKQREYNRCTNWRVESGVTPPGPLFKKYFISE